MPLCVFYKVCMYKADPNIINHPFKENDAYMVLSSLYDMCAAVTAKFCDYKLYIYTIYCDRHKCINELLFEKLGSIFFLWV